MITCAVVEFGIVQSWCHGNCRDEVVTHMQEAPALSPATKELIAEWDRWDIGQHQISGWGNQLIYLLIS